jgi:hypothetical protein
MRCFRWQPLRAGFTRIVPSSTYRMVTSHDRFHVSPRTVKPVINVSVDLSKKHVKQFRGAMVPKERSKITFTAVRTSRF